MVEIKEKKLTEKQERFAHEYILCMGNRSEAYRKAFNTSKMKQETIWSKACLMMKNDKVRARIKELQEDIEGTLDISKGIMIQTLQEVIDRSLQKVPVMKWDPIEKKEKQVVDIETGEGVWQYDSTGVNSAIDKIMKAMSYYAPEKSQALGKDGKPVDPVAPSQTIFIIPSNNRNDGN